MTDKVKKSMKWSFISETSAKLIVPVTAMILSRILSKSEFGVVAICNMVVSFVDLISDAGFSKYLIQHDFKDEKEKDDFTNIAFWTNLTVSIFLFAMIFLFRYQIGGFLGNKNHGFVISIASIQILITAFSSIQTALLRRDFRFKKLFVSRMILAFVPFIVAVPLALIYKSFWALIIGNLLAALLNAVALMRFSNWKPKAFYKIDYLKQMFSYSIWSLNEALANWAIFWFDSFVIGSYFLDYYLGLYKNASSMAMSLIGIFSTAMSPVLFSTLSRLKESKENFINAFLDIQRLVLFILIPTTLGLFLYRNTATLILFGSKWGEAADIVGAWSLMMLINVIFYSFPAELYKSYGIPKYLFLFQIAYLAFLIPALYISAGIGFWTVVYVRCGSVVIQAIISLIFMRKLFDLKIKDYLVGFLEPILASLIIFIIYFLPINIFNAIMSDLVKIVLTVVVYFAILLIFYKNKILLLLKKIK